jgi:dihydrofolate synthase/folylpolyglutamate synthase
MMRDKEHFKVISELDTVVDEFHFTQIDYHRSATAAELFEESHHPNRFMHEDAAKAFAELRANLQENDVLVVTGSLYFISFIRPFLV